MKIKTSELTGPALDWAVAKCLGWVTYPTDSIEHGDWYHTNAAIAPHGYEHNRVHRGNFKPSTDWAQGGPIIEREKIEVTPPLPDWCRKDNDLDWMATSMPQNCEGDATLEVGPTPLLAAMRCFVVSKLGDEVDVPDELINN